VTGCAAGVVVVVVDGCVVVVVDGALVVLVDGTVVVVDVLLTGGLRFAHAAGAATVSANVEHTNAATDQRASRAKNKSSPQGR
jgi:hypothetical protein